MLGKCPYGLNLLLGDFSRSDSSLCLSGFSIRFLTLAFAVYRSQLTAMKKRKPSIALEREKILSELIKSPSLNDRRLSVVSSLEP